MRVIIPVEVTPDMLEPQQFEVMPDLEPLDVQPGQRFLVSTLLTNVPEDDYPVWEPGNHTQGERRIYQHRIYEVLAEKTADSPPDGVKKSPPTWLNLGATNRWRMFDDKVGTVTEHPGSIAVHVQPGEVINSVAMLNLRGSSVRIRLIDPIDGIVYERNVPLIDAGAESWYEYFFSPIPRRADFVLMDLPAYGTATLSALVDAGGEMAAVGHMVIGRQASLGVALYGTGVGIIDYSRKSTDEFGNTEVLRRDFSKRAEFDVVVDTALVSHVQNVLASIRAQPVIWVGEESIEATILFGYYRDFSISISGPSVSDATITVEGLT